VITFKPKGLIFDLDDTLVNNKELAGNGLHERSRLMAVHEIGAARGIKSLANYSAEANAHAFRRAKLQTIESTFWYILIDAGVVSPDAIESPDHELVIEMTARKHDLHDLLIREELEALPYVQDFLQIYANQGMPLAIASTAIARHIDSALSKTGLAQYFPPQRRISYEMVTRPKPDPQVYDLAFRTLRLPEADRSHTCAFDDDPRGIAAARAAGLFVCGIATRHSREELLSLPIPPHIAADSYVDYADIFDIDIAR